METLDSRNRMAAMRFIDIHRLSRYRTKAAPEAVSMRWVLLIFLLGAIACACAVPRPDRLDTSYNEVDTPVNHAQPVAPNIRFVRPPVAPIILDKALEQVTPKPASLSSERASSKVLTLHHSHSLNDLLCTFLS